MSPRQEHRSINRSDLYQEVWSKAVTLVAADMGLSDNGVRKICARLNVPVPPRGYWQALKAGKRVQRSPLPKLKPGELFQTSITEQSASHTVPVETPTPTCAADELASRESRDDHRIIVPSALTAPHDLVRLTQRFTESARIIDGFYTTYGENALSLRISTASLDRGLRIFDALIKALEIRGYAMQMIASGGSEHVSPVNDPSSPYNRTRYLACAIVSGISIPISITEHRCRERRWDKSAWGGGAYVQSYLATGKLTIKTVEEVRGIRSSWSDSPSCQIEDALNAFIGSLIRVADHKIRRQAVEKIKAKQRKSAERASKRDSLRCERRQKIRKEAELRAKFRRDDLARRLVNWKKATELRAFAATIQERLQLQPDEVSSGRSRDGRWLLWLLGEAEKCESIAFAKPRQPAHMNDAEDTENAAEGWTELDQRVPYPETSRDALPKDFWQRRAILRHMRNR